MNEKISIHDNAKWKNSQSDGKVTLYRNSIVENSFFGYNISVGDDTCIVNCKLENNISINRRCYINDSCIGGFTYFGINTTINFTNIGKFCSIARNVDIGGFNHDYCLVSTMPSFRFSQLTGGGEKIINHPKYKDLCNIGNDVWIAAGANVLHNVTIGDGAIVGAGAVVTKDVDPYTIVAGVPAKVIKLRFDKKYINELLEIRWWNWSPEKIKINYELIINSKMSDETIRQLKAIGKN